MHQNLCHQELTFREYQNEAAKYAKYPICGKDYIYPILGLAGECGELTEKVKKLVRRYPETATPSGKESFAISQELGDILWYLSELCNVFGFTLADIARNNLIKLSEREAKGIIFGEGDNR